MCTHVYVYIHVYIHTYVCTYMYMYIYVNYMQTHLYKYVGELCLFPADRTNLDKISRVVHL